jgi:hydroxymethylglutaryl-CoA reductase (NADPH)
MPAGNEFTAAGLEKRRAFLRAQGLPFESLMAGDGVLSPEALAGHTENFIGSVQVPVGIIGPLRINGLFAHGDFYIPLATTEGALVASYNRGAYATSHCGGVSVMCLTEAVIRAPCFEFTSLSDAAYFLSWLLPMVGALQTVVATTSRHCELLDLRPTLMGKELFLSLEYHTGDAAGQNMVTLATDAVCRHLVEHAPVKPVHWYVEGNMSGDKKATMLAFMSARGKKVVAEATLECALLKKVLHVTPDAMRRYWEVSVLGGAQSGSIGIQGHFANALAALFLACGQDVACVSEASVGLTRMDVTESGDLYVAVSLPNLIVGTVGGGTSFPTARECLEMLGCNGNNGAPKFAEICAVTALAGEISIIAALAAGEFAAAHARYGRAHRQ